MPFLVFLLSLLFATANFNGEIPKKPNAEKPTKENREFIIVDIATP